MLPARRLLLTDLITRVTILYLSRDQQTRPSRHTHRCTRLRRLPRVAGIEPVNWLLPRDLRMRAILYLSRDQQTRPMSAHSQVNKAVEVAESGRD